MMFFNSILFKLPLLKGLLKDHAYIVVLGLIFYQDKKEDVEKFVIANQEEFLKNMKRKGFIKYWARFFYEYALIRLSYTAGHWDALDHISLNVEEFEATMENFKTTAEEHLDDLDAEAEKVYNKMMENKKNDSGKI